MEQNCAGAADLFTRACKGGYIRSCLRHAWMVAAGDDCSDADDEGIAVERIEARCNADADMTACTALAQYKEHGRILEKDLEDALFQYEDACEEGVSWACNNLANLYRRGDGVAVDAPRAANLYAKACQAGFLLSCADLGGMMVNGDGIARNVKEGITLIQRACGKTTNLSCVSLLSFCHIAGIESACESGGK